MSEKRNDFQELKELRILRDMYQTRVDSKFVWSEGKKRQVIDNPLSRYA